MAAFIVISVKDSLNWIVDGIVNNRPHNPDVTTYISTGKVKKIEESNYLYEYTVYSKHSRGGVSDEVLERTTESDTPRNLFKNQIAHLLNVCENQGEQINVFLLDNPMTDEDFNQSTWLTNELRSVYESRSVTNFQLVRVLFSYQIDRPEDVNRQVSKMVLNQLTKLDLEASECFLTRVLYIDNQNRSGAAICIDKVSHDLMLPRMLCDLMMLMSNKDDSYNTASAISSDTMLFSVGYSECMYYHDDVFNYLKRCYDYDLKSLLLDDNNESMSLDYEREPFGLDARQKRLAKIYESVPFDSDISLCPESVDKAIDDILISFKDDVLAIKDDAKMQAAENDRIATEKARESKLAELESAEGSIVAEQALDSAGNAQDTKHVHHNCIFLRFFNWLFGLFGRKKESELIVESKVDPRVADIVVTSEEEKVKQEYPDFIDRTEIYEQYRQEMIEGEYYEGMRFEQNVASYKFLLMFIQSSRFLRYLKNKKDGVAWSADKEKIDSIGRMNETRKKYEALKCKVDGLRLECGQAEKAVSEFRLTTHCTSVDSLIDFDKLEAKHLREKDDFMRKVIRRWQARKDETRVLSSLSEDLVEEIKWALFDFYYVKWNEPFDFIKDISLTDVCRHLKIKSQPFVNTYTLSPNAENLTYYGVYTDNEHWVNDFKNNVDMPELNKVNVTLSAHICSKICMFQFLQMNRELIDGLVDCYNKES